MEKRTEGAWIIHHTKKLSDFSYAQDFEEVETAGKCGIFLSNLSASDVNSDLNNEKVDAIRQVSNIKKTEIESIKKILKETGLIDITKDGSVSVLGVTTASVLSHTSEIFKSIHPTSFQSASIELSENISELTKEESRIKEYISDSFKLSSLETTDLFNQSEEIGLIDFEKLENKRKFYFNGNLFRRDVLKKTDAILASLKPEEIKNIQRLDLLLNEKGCAPLEKVKSILGDELLEKLQSIAMYDISEVSNTLESKSFVTKPSAFSKFGNPFEEDALDLAKAFVSSLYYGMNYSSRSRGRITMLRALLRNLVNGYEVGPATAIGEDYKILELKRVVQLRPDTGNMFYMKLLKKDIGELAMQVLEYGDTTEKTILDSTVYSGSITNYRGPEQKRYFHRKKQGEQSKKQVANLLRTFRN